ncbi:MAG: metal-dependent transcriptional regulator [Deltaproteobacteria bacterium]|nr:metal-dependent transcriptional regulator [Deltaproteobacteria bacterium]
MKPTPLTSSLEDYLETIYLLIREKKVARVRDISLARDVNSSSVSPALKRLDELGLIQHTQREYIELTPQGEIEAIRIFSRHRLLVHLFQNVFNMPESTAKTDACAMEHSLSSEGMDRLERFIEFTKNDPEGMRLMASFQRFATAKEKETGNSSREKMKMTIAGLKQGEQAKVVEIRGEGAIRQRLLDMGIMPDTLIGVERRAPVGDPIWIKLQGGQLSLRRKEAEAVVVLKERSEA